MQHTILYNKMQYKTTKYKAAL